MPSETKIGLIKHIIYVVTVYFMRVPKTEQSKTFVHWFSDRAFHNL